MARLPTRCEDCHRDSNFICAQGRDVCKLCGLEQGNSCPMSLYQDRSSFEHVTPVNYRAGACFEGCLRKIQAVNYYNDDIVASFLETCDEVLSRSPGSISDVKRAAVLVTVSSNMKHMHQITPEEAAWIVDLMEVPNPLTGKVTNTARTRVMAACEDLKPPRELCIVPVDRYDYRPVVRSAVAAAVNSAKDDIKLMQVAQLCQQKGKSKEETAAALAEYKKTRTSTVVVLPRSGTHDVFIGRFNMSCQQRAVEIHDRFVARVEVLTDASVQVPAIAFLSLQDKGLLPSALTPDCSQFSEMFVQICDRIRNKLFVTSPAANYCERVAAAIENIDGCIYDHNEDDDDLVMLPPEESSSDMDDV